MTTIDLLNKGLTEIPYWLKDRNDIFELDLSYNKITEIKNLPPNLQYLWLNNNKITEIKNLPPNLLLLYLFGNHYITEIKNLPSNLQELCLSYNQITRLPFELSLLNRLETLYYCNNPFEYIHPATRRWLRRFERNNENTKVYSDSQNIHNSNIQKSFRKSVVNIMKDKI